MILCWSRITIISNPIMTSTKWSEDFVQKSESSTVHMRRRFSRIWFVCFGYSFCLAYCNRKNHGDNTKPNRISKQREISSSSSSLDFFCVLTSDANTTEEKVKKRKDKITSKYLKITEKIDSAHCNNEPHTEITRYFFFDSFCPLCFVGCLNDMIRINGDEGQPERSVESKLFGFVRFLFMDTGIGHSKRVHSKPSIIMQKTNAINSTAV